MRTFYFTVFKGYQLLPSQSASFVLALEEICDIVEIPQVVKIAVVTAPFIKPGAQVSHHVSGVAVAIRVSINKPPKVLKALLYLIARPCP